LSSQGGIRKSIASEIVEKWHAKTPHCYQPTSSYEEFLPNLPEKEKEKETHSPTSKES
jgi:hypothetical protein